MNRALGDLYAGVMGNDDAWRDEIVAAGEASGDHAWPWPMHRRYRGLIDSAFADMKNSSVRGQAGPTYRRVVPRGVRRRGPVGARGHRRHRLLHLGPQRLPLAEGRHRLRRPPDRRARDEAERVNFDLTEEQELVRRTVRDFAEQKVAPVAEELDREHRFPYELVAELAELGLMGMPIPEEYGGGGGDTLSYAIAIEELTRIDSSVAITVAAHTSLGTMPIFLFGTEEQKREWLPDLASGKKLAAFGLTEPGAGSDAARLAHARRAARRRVGRQRLEDLHHERGHGHLGLRDDHRAHRRRTRSRT